MTNTNLVYNVKYLHIGYFIYWFPIINKILILQIFTIVQFHQFVNTFCKYRKLIDTKILRTVVKSKIQAFTSIIHLVNSYYPEVPASQARNGECN